MNLDSYKRMDAAESRRLGPASDVFIQPRVWHLCLYHWILREKLGEATCGSCKRRDAKPNSRCLGALGQQTRRRRLNAMYVG